MLNKLTKIKPWMWLLILVLIQSVLFFVYGMHKPDLFVDEWYSFSLSNAPHPTVDGYATEQLFSERLTPDFFKNLVMVSKQDLFNFAQVWENQAADVHPPFYYALLHLFCGAWGMLSDEFSILPALILNFIFLVGSDLLLYKIARRFLSQRLSLWCVFLYAFSRGCLTIALFLRMYQMLVFWILLAIYLILRLNDAKDLPHRLSRSQVYLVCALAAVHVLGFLTQYFYSIFIFFAMGIFVIWLYLNKRWVLFYANIIGAISACILSVLIFPKFIKHIVGGGYRGKEAFKNLDHTILSERIFTALDCLKAYGGMRGMFYLLIVLAFFILLSYLFKCKIVRSSQGPFFSIAMNPKLGELPLKERYYALVKEGVIFDLTKIFAPGMILITVFASILLLSKIVPFPHTLRYYAPLLPLIFLLTTICFACLTQRFRVTTKLILAVIMSVVVIIPSLNPLKFENYRTIGNIEEVRALLHAKPTTIISLVHNRAWSPENRMFQLYLNGKQSYIVFKDDLARLKAISEPEKAHIILWVDQGIKEKDTLLKQALACLNGRIVKKLFYHVGQAYLIERAP